MDVFSLLPFAQRRCRWVAALVVSISCTLTVTAIHADEICLFGDPELSLQCDGCSGDNDSCCGMLNESCFSCDHSRSLCEWGGLKPKLAESGITFQGDVTGFYMGVLDGGEARRGEFAGHGDYVFNVDAGKLGLHDGLFVKIRAEHRFGTPVGEATGTFLPPAVLGDLPVVDSENVYLTNVLLTQMLSDNFAVFAGKLDTLDGDVNAFAHGRGKTQFSNAALVATPIALRTVPYSTLGAGFIWLEEGEPIFTFTVLNPTDTARTSGFEELFEEGVSLTAELRLPTNFFQLPGHQLFGGSWSSRNYASLDQDPRVIFPSIPIARTSGSWSLYWNFDQYLVIDPKNPKNGWGVFGRAGIADAASNPIQHFLSFGVGGTSPLPNRSDDGFGVGWYYSGTSDKISPFLMAFTGPVGDGQGVELFYRAQIAPCFDITPDFQILVPGRAEIDTAYLLGLRANISF